MSRQQPRPKRDADGGIGPRRKVLIIDDDAGVQDFVRSALTEVESGANRLRPVCGVRYVLDTADDGETGIEYVRRAVESGEPYAVAFVDIRMPGCDGIDAVKAAWKADPELEIVLCTAYADYSWQELASDLGCSSRWLILKKPFHVEEIQQLAFSLSEKTELARRASQHDALAQELRNHESVEVALGESEARYRMLYAKTPAMMFSTDRNGCVIDVNDFWLEGMGYTCGEVTGRSIFEFVAEHEREYVQSVPVREFFVRGHARDVPTRFRKKNGDIIDTLVSGFVERDGNGRFVRSNAVMQDVTERLRAEAQLRLLGTALEAAANAVVILDNEATILWVNRAFTKLTGYSFDEVVGQNPRLLKSGRHGLPFYEKLWSTVLSGRVWQSEITNRRKDGEEYTEEMTITPVRGKLGAVTHFIAIKQDVTRKKALECQLRNAQKLESVGQLAAGMAHEINTPIQFIGDNTRFLRESMADLIEVSRKCESFVAAVKAGTVTPRVIAAMEKAIADADVSYLVDEIPKAIAQSLDGTDRVARIVSAMREFSQPPSEQKRLVDVNAALEAAITVSQSEWECVAEMHTDLAPDLPLVPCLPGEINTVLLHLIVNAAHAIADVVDDGDGRRGKGVIHIATELDGDCIEIHVQDTGKGIPDEIRDNIFDPFFTTKEVGRGTGQGLAVVHNVVVDRHQGTIGVDSEVGRGSTFTVRLPVKEPSVERAGVRT